MSERTYTMDEARAELARQECVMDGHSYDVHATRTMVTAGEPTWIRCTTCGETWTVAPRT